LDEGHESHFTPARQSLAPKQTDHYLQRVTTKMHAYHTHIQLGTIAQGLVVMLSILANDNIWHS